MNPNVASDIQAGSGVWTVYLTAGNLTRDGMAYADDRINGVRSAYARAAKVASNWSYSPLIINGRTVASNTLVGTNVRLIFTYIHAANGEDNGDLYRMWNDFNYKAQPIDSRPAYTAQSFIDMLKGILSLANPTHIRSTESDGMQRHDHIDHVTAAQFVGMANSSNGRVNLPWEQYMSYAADKMAANFDGYWQYEKQAIWNAYKPLDSQVGATTWDGLSARQYHHLWDAGTPWWPRWDF